MIMLNDTPAGNAPEVPVYEARTLYQVPIDLVREDPNQPRKSFDAQGLEEMIASVAKHGIIQSLIYEGKTFFQSPTYEYIRMLANAG